MYAYRQQHAVEVRVARVFDTYGPGMSKGDGRVVSNFIAAAIEERELVIHGDGSATRCFQFVEDCARGLERLMGSVWEGGPVKLGSEREVQVGELAEMDLKMVKGRSGKLKGKVEFGEMLEDDPVRRMPDCILAGKLLGWERSISLEEELKRTIDRRNLQKWG